ncbi:MAG: hypothetical protein COT91_05070 [Candidatus Doudnabacteria bacterium CG10_big_fil_rev_8_21_14_0_10_41_10]|uniref:Uncharacterized protein n=1 Tax=Candidatus Doudnabacteria bacterium CG10_big_fil_rev_8_21_14_0_10_41_10 TaxID=1974551 RepID=A0A2H0VCC2_9BACT|nr:MAG: hypothetical protein COT91_05070 [Candidatus Doudnabacteria bacterium CG10_big_fil_rev_8_21_14_0_10_41_10]
MKAKKNIIIIIIAIIIVVSLYLWQSGNVTSKNTVVNTPQGQLQVIPVDNEDIPVWVPRELLLDHKAVVMENVIKEYLDQGFVQESFSYTSDKTLEDVLNSYSDYLKEAGWQMGETTNTIGGASLIAGSYDGMELFLVNIFKDEKNANGVIVEIALTTYGID